MKKICTLLLAFIIVGSISVQAQIKFGVKGGLNLPSLNAQAGSINLDAATGWHGGLMLELKLPILGIQADVLYSQIGVDNIDIQGTLGDLKHTTLDIPVVAKIYLLKVINIQLGPQFAFVTSSKIGDFDVKGQIDNKTVSFVAGIGVELGGLMASGRFVFPSTSTIQSVGDYKSSNIQFSVGYWFKK